MITNRIIQYRSFYSLMKGHSMKKNIMLSALMFGFAALTATVAQADWWTDVTENVKDAWNKAKQQAEEQYGKHAEQPQAQRDQYTRPVEPRRFDWGSGITREDFEKFKNEPEVRAAIEKVKTARAKLAESGKSFWEKAQEYLQMNAPERAQR